MTRKEVQKELAKICRGFFTAAGYDGKRVRMYKDFAVEVYVYGNPYMKADFLKFLGKHPQFEDDGGFYQWRSEGHLLSITIC